MPQPFSSRPATWLAAAVLYLAAMPCLATPPSEVAPVASSATGLYLVFFEEAPLATYRGGVAGLEATHAASRGAHKLDAKSAASRAYLDFLERRQNAHLGAIEREIKRALEVTFRYRAGGNGVAVAMSAAEAVTTARVPGVVAVVADRLEPLATDAGPIWIGAGTIWDGSSTGGLGASKGEGTIVGVVDTGVNMQHPSFADNPADGHVFANPLGAGNHVGWCDPGNPNFDPAFVCNDKLIGAWDFADAVSTDNDGPEDDNGHGSHTASTAAGNTLLSPAISGVAPHANLITYDACFTNAQGQGQCPTSATSAGVDQAILDGVDAINYSISGGNTPWNAADIDSFFLSAVEAGIFVAASAGNSGPAASTVSHRGPWVTTVGASTHDRVTIANQLVAASGGIAPPGDITGASRTGGYGPAAVVHAGNFSNGDPNPEQCLNPFPATTWTAGEIVMCDRGSIARVLKCANVAAGGAAGCVLGNVAGGATGTNADPHVIPAIHVDTADAGILRTWLATGSGHTATITSGSLVLDPAQGDVMAGFSSRGPSDLDVLKPDVTNPGVSIYAAVNAGSIPGFPGPDFGTLSGTSMSSPHTAGSAALVRSVHPAWTPSEVKSALMSTAKVSGVLDDDGVTPATPFARGAGRVDLTRAARAGLVLDETGAAYQAANPGLGGDPQTLNVASMKSGACPGSCGWTRTVCSTAASSVLWTASTSSVAGLEISVSPASFTLAPAGCQVLDISAVIFSLPLPAAFQFASLSLRPNDAGIPVASLPIAVLGTSVGGIFADGFESGDTSQWSASTP